MDLRINNKIIYKVVWLKFLLSFRTRVYYYSIWSDLTLLWLLFYAIRNMSAFVLLSYSGRICYHILSLTKHMLRYRYSLMVRFIWSFFDRSRVYPSVYRESLSSYGHWDYWTSVSCFIISSTVTIARFRIGWVPVCNRVQANAS